MREAKCCVDGCQNKRDDTYLHYLPVNDEIRLQKWLDCINSQALKTCSKGNLRHFTVCHIHFEKRFIKPNFRLRYGAYPSLFTPEEIATGLPNVPFEDITNNEQPSRKQHHDHTYYKSEEPLSKLARLSGPVPSSSVAAHSITIGTPSTSYQTEGPASTCSVTSQSQMTEKSLPQASTSFHIEGSSFDETAVKLTKEKPPEPINRPVKDSRLAVLKTPRASRTRLITRISDLTPKCAKLYKEFNKSRTQVDYLKRAKRALQFSKENNFENFIKNLNPYAKKIFNMQIRLCTKKKQAHRFSESEKLIALSVMKQSPKCYRFLQKVFILPSKSTLNKFTAKMDVEVGINPVLLEVMKNEITSWDENKKICSIIFDEMHLSEGLNYSAKKDEIEGFTEVNERKNDFADQVLVFMLKGAVFKWQQPFAFYFCKGTTPPAALKNILKEVVAATIEIGLIPVATICDQGTSFRRALQELQQETRREQILADLPTDDTMAICGKNLSIIYDPSHLIKGLRNNFINKSLNFNGEISTWQDIVDVYITDCNHAESRLLHKLNDHHVIPEKMNSRKKMKVKTAANVLSATVSAALSYTAQFSHYADGRKVSPTMANTAKIVKFIDQLFDSMNGNSLHHKKTKGKPLKKAVTAESEHHTFWEEAVKKLEKMKFVDGKGNTVSVPTLKSCITTLKSLMRLWQFFQDKGLKVMRPRYFNSDSIENFFGQVRAYNFRHNDPDCHSFICTFKSLLVTRLISFHSENFNCEDDQADQLLKLSQILNLMKNNSPSENNANAEEEMLLEEVVTTSSSSLQPDHSLCESVNETVNEARKQRLAVHSQTYTAGWVVRKILQQTPCDECKKILTTKSEHPIHKWISHREFKEFNKKLNYPSEEAVRCFSTVMKHTNNYLEKSPEKKLLAKKIIDNIKSNYEFNLNCAKHRNDQFLSIVIKFTINNWCNTMNRILKGTDIVRLEMRKNLSKTESKALEICKKRYNKKIK